MTKKVKTEKVLEVWRIISTAKYGKLEDADKVKTWKISRALKPVATKYEEDSKDAAEKMKPSEDFDQRLVNAQEYERVSRDKNADASNLKMGAAEYGEFIKELQNYNKLVMEACKEFAEKEVDVDFEPLSEQAFEKLMSSNDWTLEQVTVVGDFIVG